MPKTLVCTSSIAMRLCAVIVTCECQRHVNERAQPKCLHTIADATAGPLSSPTHFSLYIYTYTTQTSSKKKKKNSFLFLFSYQK